MNKSETDKPNACLNLEMLNYFSGSMGNSHTQKKLNEFLNAVSLDPLEGFKEKTLCFDNFAHSMER